MLLVWITKSPTLYYAVAITRLLIYLQKISHHGGTAFIERAKLPKMLWSQNLAWSQAFNAEARCPFNSGFDTDCSKKAKLNCCHFPSLGYLTADRAKYLKVFHANANNRDYRDDLTIWMRILKRFLYEFQGPTLEYKGNYYLD